MSTWVDFKKLRETLDMEAVLRHFGVRFDRRGDQFTAFCPLPGHQAAKKKETFSANLAKGVFQCFKCGAKGNTLDLAVYFLGLNPANMQDLRTGAMEIAKVFNIDMERAPLPERKPNVRPALDPVDDKRVRLVNAPLEFELKDLDTEHEFFTRRGISKETVEFFGLGVCSRGLMKGRAVIPLHNHRGQLIGYAGRLVDDAEISKEKPKYIFPGPRESEGKVHEFQKSRFLYNGFRIKNPEKLWIVEGFSSVWHMHQMGIKDVVAVMGASLSEEQAKLILETTTNQTHVLVLPDGDTAGQRCAATVWKHLAEHRLTRWFKLATGEQPTILDIEDLQSLNK